MLHRSTMGMALFLYAQAAWAQDAIIPDKPPAEVPKVQADRPAKTAIETPKQDPQLGIDATARRVRALSDLLKSPFCPGKTLTTCTSYQAFELRKEVREMIESGMTDDQVVALLKTRHGDEISNPQQPWYTFFVPFLPFIVLAGLIFWIVQRWRKPEGQAAEVPVPETSEHLRRLREQVRLDPDEFNT